MWLMFMVFGIVVGACFDGYARNRKTDSDSFGLLAVAVWFLVSSIVTGVKISREQRTSADLAVLHAEESGYAEGYEEGFEAGGKEGQEFGDIEGYDIGYECGYDDGYQGGREDGYDEGWAGGYDEGWADGYQDAEDDYSYLIDEEQ